MKHLNYIVLVIFMAMAAAVSAQDKKRLSRLMDIRPDPMIIS